MAAVTMKMLSESSAVLLTLLRYLHLLLCNVAVALGVTKITDYGNEKKFNLPMLVEYVSITFTFVNLIAEQLTANITQSYCYDWRFAWAAFAAAYYHLLGAGSAYIMTKDKRHLHSYFIALAIFSITFERNVRVQRFLLCQLLLYMFRPFNLIPEYYLLLDGLTLPLSLVSTGDARIKFKVSEEDSHLLKLDLNYWLQVREDYADHVKLNLMFARKLFFQ